MVIDHVGLFFFPQFFVMRIIGRLAFPLFAWLIANGAHYTHDIKKYGLRLLGLAIATQIPFWYANQIVGAPALYFNVVFTLCLGLLAIAAIQRTRDWRYQALAIIACATVAAAFNTDYGAAGVLSIVAFYGFRDDFWKMALSQIVILGVMPYVVHELILQRVVNLSGVYARSPVEWIGALSLVFIYLYDRTEGRKAKYLFYVFYFLQYVVILSFQLLLGR